MGGPGCWQQGHACMPLQRGPCVRAAAAAQPLNASRPLKLLTLFAPPAACRLPPDPAGESMHMAKAAEGRNTAQDPDPIDTALHDALKPEK